MIGNLDELRTKSEIALNAMEEHAERIGTDGAAVVLFAPAEGTGDSYSALRVIGARNVIYEDQTGYNFIALAYSKIAESLETERDSGTLTRPLITGEFGYQGSAIAKDENGIIVTAFSGSTGDIDLEIARSGLNSVLSYD